MFICLNCNNEFDYPELLKIYPTESVYYIYEEVCPYCHGYFIETIE